VEIRRDLLGFFGSLAREYGDISLFSIGPFKSILLGDPDLIREVLIGQRTNCVKTPGMQRMLGVMGRGLLTNDGENHIGRRKLLQPAFHSAHIASTLSIIERHAQLRSDGWKNRTTIDLFDEIVPLSLAIVAQSVFTIDIRETDRELVEAIRITPAMFRRATNPIAGILDLLPIRNTKRMRRAKDLMHSFANDVIEKRRRSSHERYDLLSLMLSARDDEHGMSNEEIRDEIITFLLSGHETTAVAICWALYLLGQHPDIQSQLQKEIDSVIGSRPIRMDDFQRLELTRGVIAESLRLYPPVYSFGRRVVQDCHIGGYLIPGGSTIYINTYGLHRDGRFYDEPERFIPERWKGRNEREHLNYRFIPFGAGIRSCIGEPFAWMEMLGVLATLVRSWTFHSSDTQVVETEPMITLRPKRAIVLDIVKRKR
jgi:cytochrome P450